MLFLRFLAALLLTGSLPLTAEITFWWQKDRYTIPDRFVCSENRRGIADCPVREELIVYCFRQYAESNQDWLTEDRYRRIVAKAVFHFYDSIRLNRGEVTVTDGGAELLMRSTGPMPGVVPESEYEITYYLNGPGLRDPALRDGDCVLVDFRKVSGMTFRDGVYSIEIYGTLEMLNENE